MRMVIISGHSQGSDAQTWPEEVYMMKLAQDAAGGKL